MSKKISLIIPIYNTEKYLRHCLDSAIKQTYANLEIVCVDDGSMDSSGDILDEYADKDSRIIAIHQRNAGESHARNVALEHSTGDYIAFLDCDDWIEPDMHGRLVQSLEAANADMAIGRWFSEGEKSVEIINRKPVEQNVFGREQLLQYIYERDAYRGFAYMWDKLYKRELLIDKFGKPIRFDENLELGGDVLFLGKVAYNAKTAVYVDRAFYHYLQRGDSGCHSKDLKKQMDWIKSYEMLLDYFDEGVAQSTIDLVKRFMVYHCGNTAMEADKQQNDSIKEKVKAIMRMHEQVYKDANAEHPDRIQWFDKIVAL